jgi:signal recognition particle subunit SRP54
MRQMQKMGPLESLLKMVPGVNGKLLKQAKVDPKQMRHVEAIILSMTPKERKRPDIINGSRRLRIAKGSGRTVQEVNRLLDQFKQMQKLMKQFKGMGAGRGLGLPPGIGPGGVPGLFGT